LRYCPRALGWQDVTVVMTVSIVIADSIPAFRSGVRAWLEAHPDLQVVGEATDGSEAIRLVQQHQPDVLLLDLQMRGPEGGNVLELVGQYSAATRRVVFSGVQGEEWLVDALRKGALAFLPRTSDAMTVVQAVRSAATDRYFLPEPYREQPVESYLRKVHAAPADRLHALTPRQKQVLELVARGESSAAIAERLSISRRTVEQHRAYMMRKLGLRNQTELLRFALRRGIISLEE
jgi:two-component system response regulator NreC